MSYILDALKKAEAERRQDKVPGIHSQPLPFPSMAQSTPSWQRPAAWVAATAIGVAVVAAAWFKPWQSQPVQVAQALAPTATAAPPIQPAPMLPAPSVSLQDASPRPVTLATPPQPKPAPTQTGTPQTRPAEKPAVLAVPSIAEAPIPMLRELPERIQREIPELKTGGYLYADKPADRSVLINNRLLHEGDEVAPGLTLERMQPNDMILRYKEYRFRTSY